MIAKFSLVNECSKNKCIYSNKSYIALFEKVYNSQAKYIKISNSKNNAFIPFIKRKLKNDNYEAFSCYGYGGIFGNKIRLTEGDITNLKKFLSDLDIHSLFIRHAPFLENHLLWPSSKIEANRINYEVTLHMHNDFDLFKNNLPQKIRASINHAERYGFYSEWIEDSSQRNVIKDFYELYLSRMIKKSSSKFYYFNYDFFLNHLINLSNRCKLLLIKNSSNKLVSGAFFLVDPESKMVHYHLSASSEEAMKHQCNDFLILNAIYKLGNDGYIKINLGGGLNFDETDGLSKFKKKFSDKKNIFYISKIISDQIKYSQTRDEFNLREKNYFLIGDAI